MDESEMKELGFLRFIGENASPAKEPITISAKWDSLETWEKEITTLPLSKAYLYFQELFTQEEILKEPRLKAVQRRLHEAYSSLK